MSKKKEPRKRRTYAEAYAGRTAIPAQKQHVHDVAEAAKKAVLPMIGPEYPYKDSLHPTKLAEMQSPGWKKIRDFQVFNPFMWFNGSVIPNTLMMYKGITDTEKLLWGRLAQYSGEDGVCCPSIGSLTRDLGKNRSTIITGLQHLENQGFIAILKDPLDPDWSQNFYQFLFHPALVCEIKVPSLKRGKITKEHQEKMQAVKKTKSEGVESFDRGNTVVGHIDVERTEEVVVRGVESFDRGGIETCDRGGVETCDTKRTNIEEIQLVRDSACFHASHEKCTAPATPSPYTELACAQALDAQQFSTQEIERPKSDEAAYNEAADGVSLDSCSESLPVSRAKVLTLPSTNGHISPARGEKSLHYDPVLADLYAQLDGRRR